MLSEYKKVHRFSPRHSEWIEEESNMSEIRNYKNKQCEGTTKKGERCKSGAMKNQDFCGPHLDLALDLMEDENPGMEVLRQEAQLANKEETVEEETYIAILGHRPDKLGGYRADVSHLEAEVKRVVDKIPGNLVDLCGGAQGADQIGARVFFRKNLPYLLIKPFEGQEKRWPKKAQEKYGNLETHARETIVVSEVNNENYGEVVRALYKRNQFMIDKADYVVAIWNGDKKGGTAHAMRYAQAQGKTTIIIQVDDQGKHIRTVRRDPS